MNFIKFSWKAIIWAVFVFIISAIPGKIIPPVEILNADKFVHLLIYFIQTILLVAAFEKQNPGPAIPAKSLFVSFCISASYGGIIEILQDYCFINRSGNIPDFIANSIGALVAVITYRYLIKLSVIKKNL